MSGLVQVRAEEFQRMKEEMQVLRRKFKYIQGVSTVFRQKIAFILREITHRPAGMKAADLQSFYDRALLELGTLNQELSLTGDETALGRAPELVGGPRVEAPPEPLTFKEIMDRMDALEHDMSHAAEGQGGSAAEQRAARWVLNKQSREDVRRAHHLCVLLQERNDARGQLRTLKDEHAQLQHNYTQLSSKYQRLVTVVQGGGGGAGGAAVQQELHEQRTAALEDALVAARAECAQLRRGVAMPQEGGPSTTDSGTLARENKLLRGRVAALKEETVSLKLRNGGAVEDSLVGIDTLFARIRALQGEVAERDDVILQLRAGAADAERREGDVQTHVATYIDQLALATEEKQTLLAAFADHRKSAAAESSALSAAVAEYATCVTDRDAIIARMRAQLEELHSAGRRKDVDMQVLGEQIESLRSRVDAAAVAADTRSFQHASLQEVEERMLGVLAEMVDLHSGGTLAEQLTSLNGKLRNLETLEGQLRLKDDETAALRDECERLRASHNELHKAMGSTTSLFAQLPGSVGDLETLVVELEECRSELRHCARGSLVPDLAQLEGRIDVRLLEARHRRRETVLREGRAQQAAAADDDDMDDIDAALLAIPAPPALVNITHSIAMGPAPSPPPKARQRSASPAHYASPASAATGERLKDMETTFELFADACGDGRFLGAQNLRLCLSTLGIAPPAAAPSRALSKAEFIALCAGLTSNHH